MLVFDIETAPQSIEEIQRILPPFDASELDAGVDPVEAERLHWEEVVSKAPLSAVVGSVVAIGYKADAMVDLHTVIDDSESEVVACFWDRYRNIRQHRQPVIGFNSNSFDIPFLCQRSWILGITVPSTVFTQTGYLDFTFVDLRKRWLAGQYKSNFRGHSKLDTVCKAMGIPGKPSDCTGAEFHRLLLSGDQAECEAALSYLRNDVSITYQVAKRMGY